MSSFYITTAIDYANSKPHLGTAYEKIGADVIARYRRLRGDQVHFVMGNDEHSQNVRKRAQELQVEPKAYCDEMIPRFTECWDLINIQNYRFQRTSAPEHHALVQKFWQHIYEKDDVFKGEYSGWYHTTDNRYLDPDEVPPPIWFA